MPGVGRIQSEAQLAEFVRGELAVTLAQVSALSSAPRPQCRVFDTNATQSIAHNTSVPITFNSERWDLGAPAGQEHHSAADPSRLTCRVPGLYLIVGSVYWDTNSAGTYRQLFNRLNGVDPLSVAVLSPGANPGLEYQVVDQWRMGIGDYVELCVHQNSGSTLTINKNSSAYTDFMFAWLGP